MSEPIPLTNLPSGTSSRPSAPVRTTEGIVTKSFKGRFRNLRIAAGAGLFLLYFGTVWLTWDGRQAVLWDLSNRRFHIFGATFWPEDLVLLTAGLVVCAFGLFFITVLAGRVWCGYSCPQSMWTWLFLWVEKVTEGDRNQRIRLNQAPWGWEKLWRRTQKHSLWLGLGFVTALTFVGYFTPIRPLVADLLSWQVGAMTAFWLFFFTAATYINAGWLREQVCLHMCPYGRFQSVMLDEDSLVISYDVGRGEPRGHRKRDKSPAELGLGDCIDCQQCVQVCPTGIDIRDGLQMECIGCAACIDACDSVMDKVGYDRGLIRYASRNQLQKGTGLNLWRPRLLGYSAVLLVMVGALVWSAATRSLVSLDVAKDRSLFHFNGEGLVENSYRLKVVNKAAEARTFVLTATGPSDLVLDGPDQLTLSSGEVREFGLSVAVPAQSLEQVSSPLVFSVSARGGAADSATRDSSFTGPLVR